MESYGRSPVASWRFTKGFRRPVKTAAGLRWIGNGLRAVEPLPFPLKAMSALLFDLNLARHRKMATAASLDDAPQMSQQSVNSDE
jgi:hypothetical protein